MIRKCLLLLLVTSLLAVTLFVLHNTLEKANHKRWARQNLNVLPDIPMVDFDSTRFYVSLNRKTILIYFNSECNYCQYEVDQLIRSKKALKDFDLVLMSSESLDVLKSYAKENSFLDQPGISFTKINLEEAYNAFGSLAVPQIFIYGTDQRLIKEFRGETKLDAILKYL